MKELQAGIQLVRTKYIQLNRHPVFKKREAKTVGKKALPQKVGGQQSPLLPFPVRSSLAVLRQRASKGLERLERQAQRINQLSTELETALLEFKAIASEINTDWKSIQATQVSTSAIADICEYQRVNIPNLQQKPSGSFVLTSRTVDLFKAEREATLLAQTLRHRSRRKRPKN
ncbi:MAG TPA: hypothetical protein V6D14_21215 [Coleofasciculaceae cyanobacterium]|jgi:hypothetical protein